MLENVEMLRHQVEVLNKKMDVMTEVNENLCIITNKLYQSLCEQNDLINSLMRRNNN